MLEALNHGNIITMDDIPTHDHVHEGEPIVEGPACIHAHPHIHAGWQHDHVHFHAAIGPSMLTAKGNLQDPITPPDGWQV